MIGPLLAIVLLLRAALGHGHEIPCAAQACTAAQYDAQAKEDPAPIAVDMGERPAPGKVEIAPEKRPPAPIGARSARRPGETPNVGAQNAVPADGSEEK